MADKQMAPKQMILRLSVKACLLALASLSTGALYAAPAPEWEQPEVVAVNREPMKATFFNF
jgi:beta-galactosidase